VINIASIQDQNKNIEESMKETVRKLLREKEVDVVIGYGEGTLPLNVAPVFIRKEEDVDKLIWNNLCYVNLAKYLIPTLKDVIDGEQVDLKVGIVSKGCVGRAIIHLSIEHKINLDNIKIIGIPCDGIINRQQIEKEIGETEIFELSVVGDEILVKGRNFEKTFPFEDYLSEVCKTCKVTSPPSLASLQEVLVGDSLEVATVEDDFADLEEFESKTPEEKWAYIKNLLEACDRCYACREACPLCYCNLCFVDQNKPIWFGKTRELSDIVVYHMIRAFHVAGRCVACGACTGACPIGINLNLITRKLQKIVKERFDFTSGLDPDVLPPMMTHSMDDQEEFMLEED